MTCHRDFYLGDAPSRSLSSIGPSEPDTALADFLNLKQVPDMRRVEPPPGTNWGERWLRRFWLSHENGDRRKICPHCHLFLPHKLASGELAGEVLAIVGARNAGKSNFFGVLINALEGRYAHEVGFSMFAQDTFSVDEMRPISSRELYKKRYGSRLFSTQAAALNSTPSASTNADNLIPLIYRMQFPLQPWQQLMRPFSQLRALDLAIFDAAGEDLQDAVKRRQFAQYIGAASGIIFLIDPFALPGIAELLPPNMRARLPQTGDASTVIDGAISILEERNGLLADQKIPVPVAVAFTKTDMLEGIVDPDSPILRDGAHRGGFNEADCRACSDEVQDYLLKWGCKGFHQLVTSRFQSSEFFAVSALGQLPNHDSRVGTISPRRIGDPLLWLLQKRGYIPACTNGERPWS
jgi:hypothetical protein